MKLKKTNYGYTIDQQVLRFNQQYEKKTHNIEFQYMYKLINSKFVFNILMRNKASKYFKSCNFFLNSEAKFC